MDQLIAQLEADGVCPQCLLLISARLLTDEKAATDRQLEVLEYINTERAHVFPKTRPYKPTDGNMRHIRARLAEGYTTDELKIVYAYCLYHDFLRKYADTITPYRKSNFGRYLAAASNTAVSPCGSHQEASEDDSNWMDKVFKDKPL